MGRVSAGALRRVTALLPMIMVFDLGTEVIVVEQFSEPKVLGQRQRADPVTTTGLRPRHVGRPSLQSAASRCSLSGGLRPASLEWFPSGPIAGTYRRSCRPECPQGGGLPRWGGWISVSPCSDLPKLCVHCSASPCVWSISRSSHARSPHPKTGSSGVATSWSSSIVWRWHAGSARRFGHCDRRSESDLV